MAPTRKTAQTATDDTIIFLEASKKWKAELHEETLEPLAKTVAGALEDIVTSQVGTIEQMKTLGTSAKHALKGADLTQEMAKKVVTMATENDRKFTAAMQSTSKQMQELEIRSKATAMQQQKLKLTQTKTTIIAKGLRPMTLGKASQDNLKRALNLAFQFLNAGRIQVEYSRLLQRVKRDRGVNPPALKVKLLNVTDKLRLYESLKRATADGNSVA